MAKFFPGFRNLHKDRLWKQDEFLWDWQRQWRPIDRLKRLLRDNFPGASDDIINQKAQRITRWCDNVDSFRQTIITDRIIEYNDHLAAHISSLEVEYEICVKEAFNMDKVILKDPNSSSGTILIEGKWHPSIVLTLNEYIALEQRQARAAALANHNENNEEEDIDLKEGDEAVNQNNHPTQILSPNTSQPIQCPQHPPVHNQQQQDSRYHYNYNNRNTRSRSKSSSRSRSRSRSRGKRRRVRSSPSHNEEISSYHSNSNNRNSLRNNNNNYNNNRNTNPNTNQSRNNNTNPNNNNHNNSNTSNNPSPHINNRRRSSSSNRNITNQSLHNVNDFPLPTNTTV